MINEVINDIGSIVDYLDKLIYLLKSEKDSTREQDIAIAKLEEAEKIVDDMYQKRWEECGVEVENTIYMGNLDKLEYTELEKASLLLLRTELRLKKENKQLKEQLEKANKKIEKMFDDGDENKVIDDLLELQKILDIDKGE